METHVPWKWYEPHKRFYKYDASGNIVWLEPSQTKDSGDEGPWPDWEYSYSYSRYYRYEYGDDNTILQTLWSRPGPPEEAQADIRSGRCSEWIWSPHYNSYHKLMYGKEDIVLNTIWEPTSIKDAEMLINSAKRAVHFAYRGNGYLTTSYHIPPQYRTLESDKDRQRDDRNDRNRHERSGYRDSDPSGGRQPPDDGDQPDHGDDTQSNPGSSYGQYPPYASTYYAPPAYLKAQHPIIWQ